MIWNLAPMQGNISKPRVQYHQKMVKADENAVDEVKVDEKLFVQNHRMKRELEEKDDIIEQLEEDKKKAEARLEQAETVEMASLKKQLKDARRTIGEMEVHLANLSNENEGERQRLRDANARFRKELERREKLQKEMMKVEQKNSEQKMELWVLKAEHECDKQNWLLARNSLEEDINDRKDAMIGLLSRLPTLADLWCLEKIRLDQKTDIHVTFDSFLGKSLLQKSFADTKLTLHDSLMGHLGRGDHRGIDIYVEKGRQLVGVLTSLDGNKYQVELEDEGYWVAGKPWYTELKFHNVRIYGASDVDVVPASLLSILFHGKVDALEIHGALLRCTTLQKLTRYLKLEDIKMSSNTAKVPESKTHR